MREKNYNNVKKVKILFGIMAIIFLITIVTGQYIREVNTKHLEIYPFYQSLISLTYIDQILINKIMHDKLNPNTYENCHFIQPQENTIILRLDDLGAWHYNDIVNDITNEALDRNLSISMGVIPNGLEKDRKFLKWTKKYIDNPKVEFVLHGYYHTPEEFGNMTEVDALNYLELGKKKMMEFMHVVPVTFIPPHNVISTEAEKALKEKNFKILSSGKDDTDLNGTPVKLGYTATTYKFGEETSDIGHYISSSVTLNECAISLNENKICVVMIHPQDYLEHQGLLTNKRNLDEERYADFISLLDGLKEMDAEFKTYKDLLVCE